jgi:hypothetical protein
MVWRVTTLKPAELAGHVGAVAGVLCAAVNVKDIRIWSCRWMAKKCQHIVFQ